MAALHHKFKVSKATDDSTLKLMEDNIRDKDEKLIDLEDQLMNIDGESKEDKIKLNKMEYIVNRLETELRKSELQM